MDWLCPASQQHDLKPPSPSHLIVCHLRIHTCGAGVLQLLLMQRDTSVPALKRRMEHLRHAMQQTQDLLVIAQVKDKIRQASERLSVVGCCAGVCLPSASL